ncbi:hypothetical protein FS749_012873 [Ceratobasidium sp. UAMH 11750]|nr:hypothetical protein FS749_012873 [Ceratobasidium sp. UAMH 11750]
MDVEVAKTKRKQKTRAILTDALALARKAAELDTQGARGPAVTAYAESVEQLNRVLARLSVKKGRAREEEARRITNIRDTYKTRMEILIPIVGQETGPIQHARKQAPEPLSVETEKVPLSGLGHACIVDLEKGSQHAGVANKRARTMMLAVVLMLSGILALVGKYGPGIVF